jgi:hypothetical protein
MTQTLYAHMNKIKIKKNVCVKEKPNDKTFSRDDKRGRDFLSNENKEGLVYLVLSFCRYKH